MIFNVQSYKVITLGSNIINKDTVNGVWLTRCLGGSTVQGPMAAGGDGVVTVPSAQGSASGWCLP